MCNQIEAFIGKLQEEGRAINAKLSACCSCPNLMSITCRKLVKRKEFEEYISENLELKKVYLVV